MAALVGESAAVVGEDTCAGDDPEAVLNEWLGELTLLTAGLQSANGQITAIKPLEYVAPRIDSYRFSMANMEETQDADLDALLGELCALDTEYDEEISRVSTTDYPNKSSKEASIPGTVSVNRVEQTSRNVAARTHSPDNDSAFSDTVSMLSGESSSSSGASAKCKELKTKMACTQKDTSIQQKADKIKLALERMREANIKKLFIKAFSTDGSTKSLLVDEKMTCSYVARLLADKNHVTMEPRWTLVEQLPDLHMERVYEDHEHLVDNLMLWTRESKNRILFAERSDKIALFQTPEKYLLPEDERNKFIEQDEHTRQVMIEEFFGSGTANRTNVVPSVAGHTVPSVEGPLYLKHDLKKTWKKYHFILRPSGLYYFPKDKVKTLKELVCLVSFDNNEVYLGVNWKKKYKSPTDHCFAIKHPRLQQPKSVKFIKFLCAEDQQTLDRWIVAMRIAKHGRRLLDNYKGLLEELAQEDLDHLAHARSCSISSIPTKANRKSLPISGVSTVQSSNESVTNSDISSGRHSRGSSSSSSGCLSDGGTTSESTFDSEFPMGTIKRKPSMKPNIPLTWMTRQLKEMAEKEGVGEDVEDGGTLTRRPRRAARHEDGGTLKRQSGRDSDSVTYGSINGHPPSIISTTSQSSASTYNTYEALNRDSFRISSENGSSLYGYSNLFSQNEPENIEDLPLPPPPIDRTAAGMYSSTLSLESLPPPPPLDSLMEEFSGSQLSLPPPPPALALEQSGCMQDLVPKLPIVSIQRGQFPRQPSLDSVSSGTSKASEKSVYAKATFTPFMAEVNAKNICGQAPHRREDGILERVGSIKKVAFADEVDSGSIKKNKKISFACEDRPSSPRKPPPPKRSESTKLSSPKRLVDSDSNPPKDFLKDLQRVMRKKWQVAQKCKIDSTTTPHEVLGFREYPLSDDYKETSVSMWVQEHYGGGGGDEIYANGRRGGDDIYGGGGRRSGGRRAPPPAPPRRSDTTHLTTHHSQAQPSAS